MNAKAIAANSANSLFRLLGMLMLTLLGGCASFTEVPTYKEVFAEQVRCSKSVLCRTFIEDKPPVLKLAINDAPIGAVHAEVAECILKEEGIETRKVVVRLPGANGQKVLHTFLSAKIEGDWYAVDNGSLPFCGRVCKLAEALHNTELLDDGSAAQWAAK
jgi:hypothetical protein